MKHSQILRIIFFLGLLTFQQSFAQEKVDITTCDATSSGVICVAQLDTLYELCVKLKPGPSTDKKYKLDWGDGATDDITLNAETTAKHRYDLRGFAKSCGTSEVKFSIFIENATNTNDNKGFRVTFNKKPQAIPIVNEACEGSAIRFDNNSCPSSGNVSYLWEFSDGRKSTDYVPNITFTDPNQTYSVKLTATSKNCGVSSQEIPFKMSKLPVAKLDITSGFTVANTDTIVCMANGGKLSMDATISLDESQYQWSISGGSYSFVSGNAGSGKIQVKFDESKEYSITLIAKNACGNSKPVVCRHRVVSDPELTITPQPDDCDPVKYKLQTPNPLATYTFNGTPLGVAEEKDAGYSTSPYIVRASLKHDCGIKEAVPDTFFIRAKQPVKITSFRDTTICVGTSAVKLETDVIGGIWSGSFIENQGTGKVFNPTTVGVYDLSYDLGTGKCATNDKIKVSVQGVNITANDASVCEGQPTLLLKATPVGGSWTTSGCTGCIKGDTLQLGSLTSTEIKVNYTVTAPVSGGKSCNAAKEISVKVGKPKADFDISGGCSGTNAIINNKSSGAIGYQWFLNGSSTPVSTANSPSFPLPSGNVDVRLVAIAGACNNAISKSILVSTPPDPISFTTNQASGCSPFPVIFNISGTPRSDVNYSWDLGDGTTSTNFQPAVYTYQNQTPTVQSFQIKVIAKNACGEQTDSKQITVRPLAKAEIGVDSTVFRCSPASVKFSNRSTGYAGGVSWIFGDGQTSASLIDTLSHKFSAKDSIKTYKVQLVVANDCGTDTSKVDIKIYPENIKPLFTMDKFEACAGEPVKFTDATTPVPNRWLWRFGDEEKAVAANPTYAFKIPNRTYQITMIAYTNCGYDSIQRNIKIIAPPKVSFDLPIINICEGQAIQIKNTSDALNSFKWNFGDGSPLDSVSFSPNHVFLTGSSTKTITLTGYGASSTCKNEFKKDVLVRAKPKADFEIATATDTICSGKPIRFVNKSADALQYTWYFGDNQISNAQNPELSFSTGLYDVALVASYDASCKDSVYRSDYFSVDTCAVGFPEAFSPNNDGVGDYFTLFGTKGVRKISYLRIRNRWGEIIFEKRDFLPNIPSEGWNGRLKNDIDAPAGEYVYEAEVIFVGNIPQKFTDNLLVVR